jgi:hypothetical protein
MEPIYPFGENCEELPMIPPSQATNSVWLVFLYGLVQKFFVGSYRTGDERDWSIGCLDGFLRYDVKRDVLFVVRVLPSFSEGVDELDDTRAR